MNIEEQVTHKTEQILQTTKCMRQAMRMSAESKSGQDKRQHNHEAKLFGDQIDKLFREIELLKPTPR